MNALVVDAVFRVAFPAAEDWAEAQTGGVGMILELLEWLFEDEEPGRDLAGRLADILDRDRRD